MSGETVRVIVRCRPMNKRETELHCVNVVQVESSNGQVLNIYYPSLDLLRVL